MHTKPKIHEVPGSASRALQGYNDPLAAECLSVAKQVWKKEHTGEPDTFRHGNTTGGWLEGEELNAAVELLICTGEPQYSERITELRPFLWGENEYVITPAASYIFLVNAAIDLLKH
jgi:hypothetical protein